MRGIPVFIAAIVAIASPAAAADTFDLVCKGTIKQSINGRPKPYEVRYRIDLAGKRWCREACTKVMAIQAVEAGRIVLLQSDKQHSSDVQAYRWIDHTTGEWNDYFSSKVGLSSVYQDVVGQCDPADFSGFPPAKF